MHSTLLHALALALAPQSQAPLPDWVVSAGQTRTYNTAQGPLLLSSLRVEAGGTLRVVGPLAFELQASNSIEVFGTIDLSGTDSDGVATINTTNQPEFGYRGAAGGGAGGTGSVKTDESTAAGLPGQEGSGSPSGTSGAGGESSFSPSGTNARRAAGGGGGVLGPDAPESADPSDPINWGLVPQSGMGGGSAGLGAISQIEPAQGGAAGDAIFVDGQSDNDFWGAKASPAGTILGELLAPVAGSGGGGGGDAVASATFPLVPFLVTGDEKGAGGGGGGGLALLQTRSFVMGPEGKLLADGGDGGGGENTSFFDRVGGGSGGGSGGMLVIESLTFDLVGASPDAFSARGGIGGKGANNQRGNDGSGGDGGPGLIQLHTANPAAIQLPTGLDLTDLSVPNAHVLLPIL